MIDQKVASTHLFANIRGEERLQKEEEDPERRRDPSWDLKAPPMRRLIR